MPRRQNQYSCCVSEKSLLLNTIYKHSPSIKGIGHHGLKFTMVILKFSIETETRHTMTTLLGTLNKATIFSNDFS